MTSKQKQNLAAAIMAEAANIELQKELIGALRAMVDNYLATYGEEGADAPESVTVARAVLAKAGA